MSHFGVYLIINDFSYLFLLQCEPQRKVPGLYLVDSIVRQSQKYFEDKDLYGPRFAKNLNTVVQQIFATCSSEDKV